MIVFSTKLFRRGGKHILAGLFSMVLFLFPLAGCGGPQALQFTSLKLGLPAAALQSPVVGNVPGNMKLHLGITFKLNQGLLDQLEHQQIQPGKPSHLENFANKIGIDDATYQKIKDFFNLKGIGLKLSKLRTNLNVDATASLLGKVLQTHFVYHQYNGRKFYAPATSPKLPQFLANAIVAITGLDNYSAPPRHSPAIMNSGVTGSSESPTQDCGAPAQTLLPRQVAHAYGFDQLWNRGWHGEGMTVNLVEIDGSYQDDVQNYAQCVNYQGHITAIDVDGAPSQALGESTLDIEMVAGLARSANIAVYQTDGNSGYDIWTQVNDELQQIINDNTNNANGGNAVSISLGVAENQISSDDINAIDQSLSVLTKAEHMTVFVASGDCGAFSDETYRSLSVSFPASDPWATSVGGTALAVDNSGNRRGEAVWSNGSNPFSCKNRWGSGGGNSQVFRQPGWQNAYGVKNQYSHGARQVPDIAAAAINLPVYFQGQWAVVGGTSAATPIWAAGQVVVNEGLIRQIRKFTYSPQEFYFVASNSAGMRPYYDVTSGNNLYYPATNGWDYATGLGTPNLEDFYQILSQKVR